MFSSPQQKLIGGAILFVAGVAWYAPHSPLNALASVSGATNLDAIVIVLQGWAGVVTIIAGIFLAWMGRDEQEVERRMNARKDPVPDNTVQIDDARYDAVVQGSMDDVKDQVVDEELDVSQVIAAEQRHKNREELIEWLRRLQ